MKVLFVSHRSGLAGAEKCLLTLINELDRSKVEPVVVLPGPGDIVTELEKRGVKVYFVPLEWWATVKTDHGLVGCRLKQRVDKLRKIVQLVQPDVVHTNSSVVWEGALAAAYEGIPHVWHLHEKLDEHPSIHSIFPIPFTYFIIGTLSAKIITVSNAVKADVTRYITENKVEVIYNGATLTPCSPAKGPSIRDELSIPEGVVVVTTVGSLVREKGYETLIECIKKVSTTSNPRLHFIIVGDGSPDAIAALLRQIEENNLSGRVSYLGYRNDVPAILSQSDVLVVPSLSEAFPVAVLEAMAIGLPVVATDCGGPREMIADGVNGFLVPVDDSTALSQKLVELCSNRSTMKAYGKAGQALHLKSFTAEVYAKQFQNLYLGFHSSPDKGTQKLDKMFLESLMALYTRLHRKRFLKAIGLNLCRRITTFMGSR